MSKNADNRNIRVLQFLEAYEKQESLWNPALESYKNKAARDEAYMNIIRELNVPSLTIHDVKLKVKSIRTTYTKELRLLTKQKEEGKPYNPKLFWFNRANAFLKNVSLSRDKRPNSGKNNVEEYKPTVIDFITDESHRPSLGEEIDQTDNLSNLEENTSPDTYKTLKTNALESHIPDDICMSDGHAEMESTSTKNSHNIQDDYQQHNVTTISETKFSNHAIGETSTLCTPNLLGSATLTSNHKCNSIEDEYDIFCRSVAMQLRSIADSYSRSVAKLKIQQILFEAETGHYRNTACITIPVSQ